MYRHLPLLLCAGFVLGCTQQNAYEPPPPPTVTVANPLRHDVTTYLEETGATVAAQRIEIRARVSGYLEEVYFAETPEGGLARNSTAKSSASSDDESNLAGEEPGSSEAVRIEAVDEQGAREIREGGDVRKGEVLYQIEQQQYKARLAAAEAAMELAKVELDRAEIELAREKELLKKQSTAQAKVDNAQAARDGAEAAVHAAEAERDSAQQDLDYTTIVAPIDGRIERSRVKVGNLVGETEATHLTTIVQYNPIHVYFNVSERALLQFIEDKEAELKKEQAGEEPDITHNKAYLRRTIDDGFPFLGHLDYADLGVDQSTGTFTIRASFPNPDRRIVPGLFVRIRVPLGTQTGALLIPESAVGADQVGRFVIIVDENNKAARRNVELGAKFGEMIVVREGLNGDETVVVSGLQRARPGSPVTPQTIDLEVPAELLEKASESGVLESETGADSDTRKQTSEDSTGGESKGDSAPDSAANAAPDDTSDEEAGSPAETSSDASVSTDTDADAGN